MTPAIHPAGHAGVAATAAPTTLPRWRVLLGALLLALTPGLATAGAAEPEEWPTVPDQGPRSPTRIPWMTFSGDSSAPVFAMVPGQTVHAHEVVVVREHELTRRQRRLLRRAERHAEKAARLRAKTGAHAPRGAYAMVVPVAQAAAPRPVAVEPPRVHVVNVASEHEHESEDCAQPERAAAPGVPVTIELEQLSADIQRQVERALRDAHRARERAERSMRHAERAMHRGPQRSRR